MDLLSGISEPTADAVLSDARELATLERLVGATRLMRAAEWADLHPAVDDEDTAWDSDIYPSLPRVDWDAPAEFALANGVTTESGRQMILDSLELRHRLPRVWSRLVAGEVAAWRVRRIAATTASHPDAVAAAIDRIAAPIAHKIGTVTLDRLLKEALIRLHPDEMKERSRRELDRRFVRVSDRVSHEGVMDVWLRADLKDVHDFDRTVSEIAGALANAGCPESLDVRRSTAIGVMADPARAASLLGAHGSAVTPTERPFRADGPAPLEPESAEAPPAPEPTPAGSPSPPPRKKIVLYLHLAEQAVAGASPVGRMEYADRVVLADRIKDWCGRTDTHVTVVPVRDLADHIAVDSHEIPDRLAEQTELKQPTCVFPWCTRPARRCDKDHAVPHSADGLTCSCNLVPLCRHHHRLKTHTLWRYRIVEPGVFLWRAPHGHQYLRDATGTSDVGPAPDASGVTGDRSPPWSGCWHDPAA